MTKQEYRHFCEVEVFRFQKSSFIKDFLNKIFCLYFSPSTRACYLIRKMQFLYHRGMIGKIRSKFLERKIFKEFGILITPHTKIGIGFHLPHPHGIVIGHAVHIGKNVSIYQDVTLGGTRIGDSKLNNQPNISDGSIIFAGAKVLGGIVLAEFTVVGANAVLLSSTEASGVYAGIPAKLVKNNAAQK
ncbi:serine O-acetyltransferase [Victivallis sp. Marseille-Q1083]|uniref:serine O-acetyltransferase n=1 Tax=Victivallis sp. Marseille-Q1083 TaxID=2717288 RepID=UPI00158B77A7|nr:hypothetical protein [Victivallis sp. Marseille-Q1083]